MSYILGRSPKEEVHSDGDLKAIAQTKATRRFFLYIFQSEQEARAEAKTKHELFLKFFSIFFFEIFQLQSEL